MSPAPLIVISGPDGAGKTTQARRLCDALFAIEKRPVHLWSRVGYTPAFNGLKGVGRRLLGRAVPAPASPARDAALRRPVVRSLWVTTALFDLALTYGVLVRWRLLTGRPVVCDRYLSDTAVDLRVAFPDRTVEDGWLWRFVRWVAPEPRGGLPDRPARGRSPPTV